MKVVDEVHQVILPNTVHLFLHIFFSSNSYLVGESFVMIGHHTYPLEATVVEEINVVHNVA